MKVLKKVLAVAIAGSMLLTLFAGCKKEEPKDATSQSTQTTQKKDEPKQTEPITYYKRADAKKDNTPDNEKVRAFIEEKSGVKIKMMPVPSDAYKDKINLMIAAGETFDAFDFSGLGGIHWTEYLDKKALMPLNDLLDKYGSNIKKQLANGFATVSTKDGKIYGIPRKEEFPAGFVPVVREDWLKMFGMNAPTTMEELEKYFEAVLTKDPNGNGKNDEVAFLPEWGYGGIESDFKPYFTGFNGERYLDEKTGKIMPIYAHPGYKAMALKMADWYKKGYLHKEFLTIKGNQINDLILNDQLGCKAGWFTGPNGQMDDLHKKNANARYVAIPPIKGGVGVGYSSNPEYAPLIMISSTSKNAAFVIKYLDWELADKENYMTVKYGLKGQHWDWADKDKNVRKNIAAAQSTDLYNMFYQMSQVEGAGTAHITTIEGGGDWKAQETTKHRENVRSQNIKLFAPFDSHIPYVDKGTAAETLTGDGKTMIEEARTKLILGASKEADFDAALKKYMEIEGNIRSDVWTKQYKAFTGK